MKEIWNKYDNAYKYLFSHKGIFLQFLHSFMDFDFVKGLTEENLERVDKSFVSEEFTSRESDIIYKINLDSKEIYILFLLEFQSTPDKTFPVRIALYTLQLYESILRNSQKGKLPSIFPALLYNGSENWNVPTNLFDLIEQTIPEKYIPSFEYFPLIEKDIPDDTLKQLHNLISAVIYLEKRKDEKDLQNAIQEVIDFIKTEDIFNLRVFAVWLKRMFRQKLVLDEIDQLNDYMEVKTMITQIAEKIEKRGIEQGIEQGKIEDAEKMLKKGYSVSDIFDITGLSRKQIESIKDK